jgi:hypothetical protein
MRTLPINAPDDAIKNLVVEWSELLAEKRFSDALALFLASPEELEWTADTLERVIAGYGALDQDPKVLQMMHENWEVDRFEVTTLIDREDRDEILEKMNVDRENLYGLNPVDYVGMVHYEDIPLSGYRSDMTARFHIKRIGDQQLTLEFLDIHVM